MAFNAAVAYNPGSYTGSPALNKWYWVSSEITQYEGGLIFVNPTDMFWHTAYKNGRGYIRSFVKY